VREQAERRVQTALADTPLRRWLFRWVLRNARNRVRDRENLRFERTRVFGRARQIFVELGRRFYAIDAFADPRAIFYLNVDEILGFVDGTTTCTDLQALAALRKTEFDRFGQLPAPAERFATQGMVHQGNLFQPVQAPVVAAPQGDELRGVGCCAGIVRGRVRVVTNPLTVQLAPGDILVAERTDPSWIMIMPAAAGLLVERGSLLSHAAIVSRELGIPSIVSLTGVTRWLKDGDPVEMDGSTGVVKRLRDWEI
jgi:pyruvate,water dikinase